MRLRTVTRIASATVSISTVLACTVTLTVAGAAVPARAPKPTISTLAASPTVVSTTDGTVSITADVANATTCELSATPTVPGLPTTTSCATGPFAQVVRVPFDSGPKSVRYRFTVSAVGTGGAKSKNLKVSVKSASGQAYPLAFTATYAGPDDGLDQVDAHLTLAGSVNGVGASWTTVSGTWTVLPSGECPAASAIADPADGGIGGGGILQASPDSPTGYLAYFDFGVWSDVLSAPPCSGFQDFFVAHLSDYLPFVPGSAQSTWPSVGGGTFTFYWTY